MKINSFSGNISSRNNVNFGHIYSNAVDKVRKYNDNYFKEYYYDTYDDYNEMPMLREGYECTKGKDSIELMSDKEVSRLGELVGRASKLTKSIIAGMNGGIQLLVLIDGNRSKAGATRLAYNDKKNNLDELEKLVEKAEAYERNPDADDIEPIVAEKQYDRLDKEKAEPRYNEIYSKTICNDGCSKL